MVVELLTVVIAHLRGRVGHNGLGDLVHGESTVAGVGAHTWGVGKTGAAHVMARALADGNFMEIWIIEPDNLESRPSLKYTVH